jgi:hypothetical protein
LLNRNGAQESVTFFQTHYLQKTLEQLGLATRLASLPLPAWFVVSVSIYLLGSLGLRAIGVPSLMKDLLCPRSETAARFLIATFAVIGAVIGLAVTLVPKNIPGSYNNSIWFYADSKYVMWLFGVEAIQVLLRTRSIAQGAIIAAVALIVSVPSAIKHFIGFNSALRSNLLSAQAVDALEFLKINSRPGEVVLSPSEMVGPVLTNTKCHVPIGPYANHLAPWEQLSRRKADLHKFWADWRSGLARSELLRVHRINYLLFNKARESRPNVVPGLTVIFEDADWLIYRVSDEAIQSSAHVEHSKIM